MTSSEKSHPIRSWIIEHVLENPKKAIALPVLFTLSMGLGINYLVIDDDMMAMLPETLDSRMSWDAVQDEFGSTEVIFIAFGNKGRTVYSSESFALLWDLTKALENVNQVEKVSCITTISKIESEDGFMEISDLQPARDLSLSQIDKIKEYLLTFAHGDKEIDTQFISCCQNIHPGHTRYFQYMYWVVRIPKLQLYPFRLRFQIPGLDCLDRSQPIHCLEF